MTKYDLTIMVEFAGDSLSNHILNMLENISDDTYDEQEQEQKEQKAFDEFYEKGFDGVLLGRIDGQYVICIMGIGNNLRDATLNAVKFIESRDNNIRAVGVMESEEVLGLA